MIACACDDPGFSCAAAFLPPAFDFSGSASAAWLLRTVGSTCDSRSFEVPLPCVSGGGREPSFLRLDTDGFRNCPSGSPIPGDTCREIDGSCEPPRTRSGCAFTDSDCILCLAGPALAVDAFEALEMLRRFFFVFDEVPGNS